MFPIAHSVCIPATRHRGCVAHIRRKMIPETNVSAFKTENKGPILYLLVSHERCPSKWWGALPLCHYYVMTSCFLSRK